MASPEGAAREVLVQTCRRLDRQGLAPARSGNVSMALGDRILITATGTTLGLIQPQEIAVVDRQGRTLSPIPPSSELPLHLALHRLVDRGVAAVVHTHSPYATALSYVGKELPLVSEEGLRTLQQVPVLPYRPPGSQDLAEVAQAAAAEGYRAFLLERHGVVTWGRSLAEAAYLAELVEAEARLGYLIRGWEGGLGHGGSHHP